MRVAEHAWSVRLNERERRRHLRAFPAHDDVPPIFIRRLDDDRFVVESRNLDGRPVRLAKCGSWEEYAENDRARVTHKFSTWESALNALDRGERDGNRSAARLTEMEGADAAA